MATATTSLKLDVELKERVQRLAAARRRSPHWILREAVAQFLEQEEKKETIRQQTLAVWNEYQSNGQHLTEEETHAWLQRLAAGESVEPPPCHT